MSDTSITKRALADGFKELLKIKSFEKITITDITSKCGLNRQTFYYHFQDKYDLINWIVYQEGILMVKNDLTIDNWDQKVSKLLSIMKKDKLFYQTTLKDIEGTEFSNYLFSVTRDIFLEMIDHISLNNHSDHTIDNNKKYFVAEFLSHGVVGMITSWAKNGMKQDPEEITESIRDIISESRFFFMTRYFDEIKSC
ncbi:TetR/AcrR family transcriptional regulator C-terminal domain-containing protein [Eubacteriaceae bacterium ES2]|nr:TetR/AcrR family transcriptional regulator C-terminal domain-containing protein [Eubacteriaceae bacterium ES2]